MIWRRFEEVDRKSGAMGSGLKPPIASLTLLTHHSPGGRIRVSGRAVGLEIGDHLFGRGRHA